MRISHTELEQCLRTPNSWLANRSSSSGPRSIGYDTLLKYAINRYHKTESPQEATTYLKAKFNQHKHKLKNKRRIDGAFDALDDYIEWCLKNELIVADSRGIVRLNVGGYLELSGIISRIDLVSSGYRGILLGPIKANWKSELRMPLLQKAIAEKYARPLHEVSIGVQDLTAASLTSTSFSLATVRKSEKAFIKLGDLVKSLGAR